MIIYRKKTMVLRKLLGQIYPSNVANPSCPNNFQGTKFQPLFILLKLNQKMINYKKKRIILFVQLL